MLPWGSCIPTQVRISSLGSIRKQCVVNVPAARFSFPADGTTAERFPFPKLGVILQILHSPLTIRKWCEKVQQVCTFNWITSIQPTCPKTTRPNQSNADRPTHSMLMPQSMSSVDPIGRRINSTDGQLVRSWLRCVIQSGGEDQFGQRLITISELLLHNDCSQTVRLA